MGMSRTVTAFCLKQHAFGEADAVCVLFSREQGIVRAIAKGLRKPKSKVGGKLEPFRENDVLLASGRRLDVIAQVETRHAYKEVLKDFDALAAGMSANEVLLAFLPDNEPQPVVYDRYAELLDALVPGAPAETLLAAFELHLMSLLGYQPNLEACVGCDEPITIESVYGLHLEQGGMLCRTCAARGGYGRALALSPGVWQYLHRLQHAPLEAARRIKAAPRVAAQARHALAAYVALHAEQDLKAQGMFDWQVDLSPSGR